MDLTAATGLKVVLRRPAASPTTGRTPSEEPAANVELQAALVGGYVEARPATTDEIDRTGTWEAYAGFTLAGVQHLTVSTKFRVIPV